jgi:PAS domain S-box-containing protein
MREPTEQKRAEEACRESEEQFRATFEQAAVGMAHVGLDGRCLRVNQKLCGILGYGHDEMMGLTFADMTHPDDREADLADVRRLLAGEVTAYSTQNRYARKDKSLVCIKLTVSLARTPQDQPDYFIFVVEDISELKRAEDQFRTLADSIPQLCWIADLEGYIVWYNRRWLDYTGKTLEQMWGRKWAPVLDSHVQPSVLERWLESVATGHPLEMVIPIKGRDAVYRPFLTRVEALEDHAQRVVQWFGTNTDISELKRAEEALKESARTHRIVADNTYDFEFWRAPDGRYLYVSPSCERICGHKPADFMADPDLLERLVHREDRARFEEQTRALMASHSCVEFEFRIVHQDGTVRWLAQVCQPVLGEQGEYLGLRGSNREVTERKRAEQALRDADRRKDEFLAMLAHELRNPLAAIRSALQILRLSPDREAHEQARALMQRQTDQMVRLVDDLLDVSRIATGKLELRKEPVQLRLVVRSAVEISRPLIEHMGHELTVTLPPHPLTVDADMTRLAQVFSNLLNNAAKYTEHGGHIWLTVERQGSDVLVSVKDNGIGIAADHLPGVFRMFSQVQESLERAQGGLGIGLTLVKRLVEMHGGRIEARSEGRGKGAEFVVHLPLIVEACGPNAPAEPDEPPAPKSSLRILIVDDNRGCADSLGMLLRIMGYDIHTAYDGQQGFEVAKEFRPDVALLDIDLPKLDGYEVCRRIREQPWGKGVILIAATGWGHEEDRRRSHDAGFDRHLVKPVDSGALMRMLTELQKVKP